MTAAASMRERVLGTLRQAGAAETAACWFVPGRIEVLGKHTDYAGGRSLLTAVDRGIVIAAAPRRDNVVRVIDCDTGAQFESGEDTPSAGGAASWTVYPRAVLRRCALNFPTASGGADIGFASDLPQASGLSSSSALVVGMFLALDAVRGMSRTARYAAAIRTTEELAAYLGAVENGLSFGPLAGEAGVGTMGGSEDHMAILCARPGRVVQYAFIPPEYEGEAAVPAGWTFAVASSGVRAEKAGAALASYNNLAASTHRLVQLWRDAGAGEHSTLGAIVASEPDATLRLREIVRANAAAESSQLLPRLAQFVTESDEIIPAARAALERGDIAGFSMLVRRSQEYAEHSLHNQVPETISLVARAHALGAAAASAFGAGFGGSVWALVREDGAHEFAAAWQSDYIERFSERRAAAAFFITPAAPPARRIEDIA